MPRVMFDADAFVERAAIREYDGGLTRFRAETLAAQDQGTSRWEALRHEANDIGDTPGTGHQRSVADGDAARDMPAMQPAQAQEDRPMPERDVHAGRSGGALPPLRRQLRSEA